MKRRARRVARPAGRKPTSVVRLVEDKVFDEFAVVERERLTRVALRALGRVGLADQRQAWAEEVVQQALAEAWEHRERCNKALLGFICDIVRKRARDRSRRMWREIAVESFEQTHLWGVTGVPSEEELIERHDQDVAMAAAFKALPLLLSAVFAMWLVGYGMNEISGELALTRDSASQRLLEARACMRRYCLARGIRPKAYDRY